MRILVHHQGQQLGPFSVEEVRARLAAGTLGGQDLAWWEGAPAWAPVTSVPGLGVIGGSGVGGGAGAVGGLGGGVGAVGGAGAGPVVAVSGDGSALALWSLILGILSLVGCMFFSGIPAVICGHMALARKSRGKVEQGKGMAIAGLVTGYGGTLLTTVGLAVMAAFMLPAFSAVKNNAGRMQSLANAHVIVAALDMYTVQHGGAYPATLQEMVGKELLNEKMLVDPLAPEFGNDGFVYVRPEANDPPGKAILIGRGKGADGRRVVAHKDNTVDFEATSIPADL